MRLNKIPNKTLIKIKLIQEDIFIICPIFKNRNKKTFIAPKKLLSDENSPKTLQEEIITFNE